MVVRFIARGATLLAVIALPLLLTGCVRYTVDAQINSNDTISGSFVFALSKEAIAQTYDNETQYLAELKKYLVAEPGSGDSELLVPPRPKDGEVTLSVYRVGKMLGYRQRFDRVPLSELEPSLISVRHVDRRFIVDVKATFLNSEKLEGPLRAGSETAAPPSTPPSGDATGQLAEQLRSQGVDPDLVLGDNRPDLRMQLSFPGEIIAGNGAVEGRTVVWKLTLGNTSDLHVSAWDSPRNRSWSTQLFLAICAVGGLGVLYQLIRYRLRRRGAAAGLPAEVEPPPLGFAGLPSLGGDGEPPTDRTNVRL
jgi:hypothetical protein